MDFSQPSRRAAYGEVLNTWVGGEGGQKVISRMRLSSFWVTEGDTRKVDGGAFNCLTEFWRWEVLKDVSEDRRVGGDYRWVRVSREGKDAVVVGVPCGSQNA